MLSHSLSSAGQGQERGLAGIKMERLIEIRAERSLTNYRHRQTHLGDNECNLSPIKIDADSKKHTKIQTLLPLGPFSQVHLLSFIPTSAFPPSSAGELDNRGLCSVHNSSCVTPSSSHFPLIPAYAISTAASSHALQWGCRTQLKPAVFGIQQPWSFCTKELSSHLPSTGHRHPVQSFKILGLSMPVISIRFLWIEVSKTSMLLVKPSWKEKMGRIVVSMTFSFNLISSSSVCGSADTSHGLFFSLCWFLLEIHLEISLWPDPWEQKIVFLLFYE